MMIFICICLALIAVSNVFTLFYYVGWITENKTYTMAALKQTERLLEQNNRTRELERRLEESHAAYRNLLRVYEQNGSSYRGIYNTATARNDFDF